MAFRLLAADYDGTLAQGGRMAAATVRALLRLRSREWRVVLVTGRELDDLERLGQPLEVFDRVVAENGSVLFDPRTGRRELLAPALPRRLSDELRRVGVAPLSHGCVLICTRKRNAPLVRRVLQEQGERCTLAFNRGSLMLLPPGVDKGSGLDAALAALGGSAADAVGVGDGENDEPLLRRCGLGVAVANAVPSLRRQAAQVTVAPGAAGVRELIEGLLGAEEEPNSPKPLTASRRGSTMEA